MIHRRLLAATCVAVLALAAPALAQHEGHGAPSPTPSGTVSLQGGADEWAKDPHMHAFYALSVKSLGKGAKPDFAEYQKQAYAIFGDFGASHGMKPEAMIDHLKAIPGQMVQIVKEDPHVLDSYETFKDALFGPP